MLRKVLLNAVALIVYLEGRLCRNQTRCPYVIENIRVEIEVRFLSFFFLLAHNQISYFCSGTCLRNIKPAELENVIAALAEITECHGLFLTL